MRCARYKTIPPKNRKVPHGISRQRELITLIERRFAQAELIREAARLARTNSKSADAEDAQPADAKAAQPADTEGAQIADADAAQIADADAAQTADAESTQPADADAAQSADAEGAQSADAEAAQPADAEGAQTADAEDAQPLRAVTFRWHGQLETVTSPEAWLAVFRDVENGGDAITRELARRRFLDEPYWKTCDALYLSPSTYYQHIREILHYALACAVSYGILDPRPPKQMPEKAG